jgi:hypothetical protein
MTGSSGIGSEQQHYSGRRPIHGSDHERRSACWQEGKAERFLVCVLQTPVLGRGIRGTKNSAASRFAWHLVYRVFLLIQNRCAAWKKKVKRTNKNTDFFSWSMMRWKRTLGCTCKLSNWASGRQQHDPSLSLLQLLLPHAAGPPQSDDPMRPEHCVFLLGTWPQWFTGVHRTSLSALSLFNTTIYDHNAAFLYIRNKNSANMKQHSSANIQNFG